MAWSPCPLAYLPDELLSTRHGKFVLKVMMNRNDTEGANTFILRQFLTKKYIMK